MRLFFENSSGGEVDDRRFLRTGNSGSNRDGPAAVSHLQA